MGWKGDELTSSLSLRTVMVSQLSVLNAMASSATAARLKMVAKARVTALQKPMARPSQLTPRGAAGAD